MPPPMRMPHRMALDTPESKLPLSHLIALASRNLPACTSWPERVIAMVDSAPPLPGTWRVKGLPEAYIGWPVLLHAGARPGGSAHPIQADLEVERWAGIVREAGSTVDLSMDRVKAAARLAHGFMVPLREVPDGDPSIPFRDQLFGKFFVPFAQVWRFEEPVFVGCGRLLWWFAKGAEHKAAVKAMRTATRVL